MVVRASGSGMMSTSARSCWWPPAGGGQITLPEGISREQLLDDLTHLDSLDRQVVVPHRITASELKIQ
ncbi:MAG: hypothetical protein WBV22_02670 [Anaerolineaceae bacterium]